MASAAMQPLAYGLPAHQEDDSCGLVGGRREEAQAAGARGLPQGTRARGTESLVIGVAELHYPAPQKS